ncbi:MAG: F0F1 ATP synthase subunit B [Bacteroidetes bacterium]|nr:F0F1 ATP synthase subunit B [Bacteroidota bacterium]MBU1679369.1 F0F1 ATP synthase subunit B [Bacteroidota bacterium]MBU2507621.1 F0F1 ATP synthase subunit B [Bacteroidota bacterium]
MVSMLNIALIAFASGAQGSLLDVNPGLIFWTVITFVLLLLILKKIAWKPILSSLSERENFIRESLEKAEAAQNETQKLLEENKSRLAKADEEAKIIVAQSKEHAQSLKTQILDQSKQEAKSMIDAAASEIERRNQEAFNSLKEQVASIAVEAAEKILRETLDKDKKQNLVDKYMKDLSKN